MKNQIHKVLKKLGYKISNISKKEKSIKDLVRSFAVTNDTHNLVISSAAYLFEIKKHFPELVLESHKEGVLASFNGLQLYVETSEEFFILKEVFIEKDYNLLSNESFVVFDIGMNIGISSLFFGLKKNVEKIYSFEPVLPTYNQALYNLELNKTYSNKIEAFNFGLGGFTRIEKVLYNSQAKGNCGIRLDLSLVIDRYNAEEIEINIKNVSEVLPDLLAKHSGQKKVLKIDCEGAEYEIIQKLNDANLLVDIDALLIEWHDKGAAILEGILTANNFRIISRHLTPITGMIYAFKK
ncbi:MULTISPECIES: FkbM family methyltransferase [unclassified Flavobacterium]|jgi:FkbM family methyltransferase|uniref:FkbM family methyltransferase n=1 Tax=unclassified Flavobacterium TaxID=196869 RepID=UPI0025BEFC12|nr:MULTISPECIES: FkbM family methyltransferase [unclassified Flavobacterium]